MPHDEFNSEDFLRAGSMAVMLDALSQGEAIGTLSNLRAHRRKGSRGNWQMVKGTTFLEIVIRTSEGRIATIPTPKNQPITPEQREADAQFITEIQQNADWILRAAEFAIEKGFRP